MRLILSLAIVATLAGCSPKAEKPVEIGRYQVVATNDGAIRIDTTTGKTEMLVLFDEQVKKEGTYAIQGNRFWGWAEVPLSE